MSKLRIGSVPYLNVKPLVDWFHDASCDVEVEMVYEVPSRLAEMLRRDELDVANVSIFEGLQNPGLVLVPDISISADGEVKSVRLFHKPALTELKTVALDTSSLTSVALTKVLLERHFDVHPQYVHHAPDFTAMTETYGAGLIIGDLKLFDLHHGEIHVFDLGAGWKDYTDLPFVYAGWLAREDRYSSEMRSALERAKAWGIERRGDLALKWAAKWNLPLERSLDYLLHVMNYDLGEKQMQGLTRYQDECLALGLLKERYPIRFAQD